MVPLSPEAVHQLDQFTAAYDRPERLEAAKYLAAAVKKARLDILANPEIGSPRLRIYPKLHRPGLFWHKEHRYWFAYTKSPLVIIGIFDATFGIPGYFGESNL